MVDKITVLGVEHSSELHTTCALSYFMENTPGILTLESSVDRVKTYKPYPSVFLDDEVGVFAPPNPNYPPVNTSYIDKIVSKQIYKVAEAASIDKNANISEIDGDVEGILSAAAKSGDIPTVLVDLPIMHSIQRNISSMGFLDKIKLLVKTYFCFSASKRQKLFTRVFNSPDAEEVNNSREKFMVKQITELSDTTDSEYILATCGLNHEDALVERLEAKFDEDVIIERGVSPNICTDYPEWERINSDPSLITRDDRLDRILRFQKEDKEILMYFGRDDKLNLKTYKNERTTFSKTYDTDIDNFEGSFESMLYDAAFIMTVNDSVF